MSDNYSINLFFPHKIQFNFCLTKREYHILLLKLKNFCQIYFQFVKSGIIRLFLKVINIHVLLNFNTVS